MEAANWIAAGVFLTGVIFAAVAAFRASRPDKVELARAELAEADRAALVLLQHSLNDFRSDVMELHLSIRGLSADLKRRR